MSDVKLDRIPFVALALFCLVAGVIAGLARLGWTSLSFPAMVHHGAIMTGGFLGTLITLEKIIPLKRKPLYIFPVLSAASVVLFFTGETSLGFILLVLASSGLSLVFIIYLLRERLLIYLMMTCGAMCWATGNILLAVGGSYLVAVPWWISFALLIISAERIELMKFLPVSQRQKYSFAAILAMFVLSSLFSFHGQGALIGGVALTLGSVWLLRFDLIGITIHKEGLTRFVAWALLSGYATLLLCGISMISSGHGAFAYDTTVHLFFIGFVFSMIFAHGPIILPGVLGSSAKPYHKVLYLWLVLLHASWVLRAAGGLFVRFDWRMISGLLTALAITAYFVTLATLTVRAVRKKNRSIAPKKRTDECHDSAVASSLNCLAKRH